MRTRFSATSAAIRLGRARLALAAWLVARKAGAPFLLRLHDAQPPADLAWLGLDWDLADADRAGRHTEAAEALRAAGRLYPCLETEDELRWKREQAARRGRAPIYDRAMLKLTDAQRATAEAGGKRPYWRFRLSDAEVSWRDAASGRQTIKLTSLSDPVVVAADGTPSSLFAAAVDDRDEAIGLVIRETAQIETSAIQLDLTAALGGDPAGLAFAHLPPLPEALSATTLRRLRQDGVEPAAVATLLAAPGSAIPAGPAGLVARFDLAALGNKRAGIGPDRLRALNRLALADSPYAAVAGRLPEGATEAFWLAVRGGIEFLTEARHWWDVVAGTIVPPVQTADLRAAAGRLPPEPWDATTWERWAGPDAAALRLALTGEETGPEMAGLLPLIDGDRVRARLLAGSATTSR